MSIILVSMKDGRRNMCNVWKIVICYSCKKVKKSISHYVSEKKKISDSTSNKDESLFASENEMEEVWEENKSINEERCEETDILIVKPEASSQGKGIYLTRDIDEIALEEHVVVQLYLNKPLCMDKMKFDLRLYVLVLGINPLRIYLSKEGLARLSTK